MKGPLRSGAEGAAAEHLADNCAGHALAPPPRAGSLLLQISSNYDSLKFLRNSIPDVVP